MKKILAATGLMLVLVASPILAGEGHSCCKKGDKAAAASEKCDPKNCPPEKCDKDKAAKCEHHAKGASSKPETAKPAPKPS